MKELRTDSRKDGLWIARWEQDYLSPTLVKIIDLSRGGCRIKHNGEIFPGARGRLVFYLRTAADMSPFQSISAEVLRVNKSGDFVIETQSAVKFLETPTAVHGIDELLRGN